MIYGGTGDMYTGEYLQSKRHGKG